MRRRGRKADDIVLLRLSDLHTRNGNTTFIYISNNKGIFTFRQAAYFDIAFLFGNDGIAIYFPIFHGLNAERS